MLCILESDYDYNSFYNGIISKCQTKHSQFSVNIGPNNIFVGKYLIIKLICHLYNSRVLYAVMAYTIAAVSKYHITDRDSGINMGRHPKDAAAKKAFWQQRPLLPRYHGTYDIRIILRFIENLGENKSLSLKQLSFKTVFLVAFSTLSRYYWCPQETIRI